MQGVGDDDAGERGVHRGAGNGDLVDDVLADGRFGRRAQGLRQRRDGDEVGHPHLCGVDGGVDAAVGRQRGVFLQLRLVGPGLVRGDVGAEADAVVDGGALAGVDGDAEREAHFAAAQGVAVVGGGKRGAVGADGDPGEAREVELARQRVGEEDVVRGRQAVVARRQAEVHDVGGDVDLVGVGRGAAADAAAGEVDLGDRAHLRLPDVDRLGRGQAVGIGRGVAAGVGKLGGVLAQDRGGVVDARRRRGGDDARDVADDQLVDRAAVGGVDDVAEVPRQRAGRARGRLRRKGVAERAARAGDDLEALQRQARRQNVGDDDVARRVFLQVQREFVGDGVADADDGVGRARRHLGVVVGDHRLGERGVVDRAHRNRRCDGAVVVGRGEAGAAFAGALAALPALQRGPVDVGTVDDLRAGDRDDRRAVGQRQRLAGFDVEAVVSVRGAPGERPVGQRRRRRDEAGDRATIDGSGRGAGHELELDRQRVDDAGVERGGGAGVGHGDRVLEYVADGRCAGLAGRGEEAHALGGGERRLDDRHLGRGRAASGPFGRVVAVRAVVGVGRAVAEGLAGVVAERVLQFDRDLDDGLAAGRDVDAGDRVFHDERVAADAMAEQPAIGYETRADDAQVDPRRQRVDDAHVVERHAGGRRHGHRIGELLADRPGRLAGGVRLGQRAGGHDGDLGRIARHRRLAGVGQQLRRAVGVGVVARRVRQRARLRAVGVGARDERLVRNDRARGERRHQRDVELELILVVVAELERGNGDRAAADRRRDRQRGTGDMDGERGGVEGRVDRVGDRADLERRQREVLDLHRVAQAVAGQRGRCRGGAVGQVLDRLQEIVAGDCGVDAVGVLVIERSRRAVAERKRAPGLARIAADVVVPLRRPGDVGVDAVRCRTGVEPRFVGDDEALAGRDPHAIAKRERERAFGKRRTGGRIGRGIVGAGDQHGGNRRDAVGREDPCGERRQRRRAAHAGRQDIGDRHVPRVVPADVLHVDLEGGRAFQVQVGDGARLVDHEVGRDDRHRQGGAAPRMQVDHGRRARCFVRPCVRNGLVEPHLGSVGELPAGVIDVDVVIQNDRQLDVDAVALRDALQVGVVLVREDDGIRRHAGMAGQPGRARAGDERVSAVEERPGSGAGVDQIRLVGHVAERSARQAEVVDDHDIADVRVARRGDLVERAVALLVDGPHAELRRRHRVGEGNADGGRALSNGIGLDDHFHRHHEFPAFLGDVVEAARRPVDPEIGILRVVARHVAFVMDVVEDDVVVGAGREIEVDVGAGETREAVVDRPVLDQAARVDLQREVVVGSDPAVGRRVEAVDHAAEIDAAGQGACLRRAGRAEQQAEEHQQREAELRAARSRSISLTRQHGAARVPTECPRRAHA